MLPKEALEEFKKLYKKRFGVDLTDDEASFRMNNFKIIWKVVWGSNISDTKNTEKNNSQSTQSDD